MASSLAHVRLCIVCVHVQQHTAYSPCERHSLAQHMLQVLLTGKHELVQDVGSVHPQVCIAALLPHLLGLAGNVWMQWCRCTATPCMYSNLAGIHWVIHCCLLVT